MGASTITGIPTNIIAAAWGGCILLIINISEDAVKSLEKLLAVTVSIMALVFTLTMIISRPDLGEIAKGFIPTVPGGSVLTCVALIGTTVVPYNMFIHTTSARKTWNDPKQLPLARFDTTVTMILGGIITAAIMISAGAVIRGMDVTSAAGVSASTGFNPVSIIMTAQAVNGIFLPVVVFLLVYLTSRKKLMGEYRSTTAQNVLGVLVGVITLVVGISSIISLLS